MREYVIYTDGSCYHKNNSGGYATIVISIFDGNHLTVAGSSTNTTVARMEFLAMLDGLEIILEDFTKEAMRKPHEDEIMAYWFSDREDLVKSVNGEYKRKVNQDLWARFDYYNSFIKIKAQFVPRATHKLNIICDKVAGTMRKLPLQNKINEILNEKIQNSFHGGQSSAGRPVGQTVKA